MPMSDEEFDAYLAECEEELEDKQDALVDEFDLGSYAEFHFDQTTGALEFRREDGTPGVVAAVIPIGSHAERSETFQWAWANESLLPELRLEAARLKELEAPTGMEVFGMPTFTVEEEMPWQVAAFAVRHRTWWSEQSGGR